MLISKTSCLIIRICGFRFMMCLLVSLGRQQKILFLWLERWMRVYRRMKKFEGSNFLHFRVAVDVSKLLCRGRKIILGN